MWDRVDFKRRDNGCKTLLNMTCATQGAVVRRPGFQFIFDMDLRGIDTNGSIRMIPFIFNENQAYTMIFFTHTNGSKRVIFGTGDGIVVSGAGNTPVTLVLPSTWDIDNFDYAQSADEMYFAQSGLKPHTIKRLSHTSWQVVSLTMANQPSDWSNANGWPETVIFHQQRLVFGANKIRRQTVWMSKAGSFLDFGKSSPGVDSDAVTFTLDSGTQNKIVWMSSTKSLHIGTIGNEWTVVGGNRRAITPTNVLAERQTNRGSHKIKPLVIGITTMFIERQARRINEFVYDYTFDSYKTSDVSILSPHITEQAYMLDWTYQQSPDSIIWAVMSDGTLAAVTYQRQHSVIGWHRHDTQGQFLAVTSIPNKYSREDEVWVLVKRKVNNVDKIYVEKLAESYKGETAQKEVSQRGYFLDSWLFQHNDTPVSYIYAPHLKGRKVSVMVDNAVHPDKVIPTSGLDNGVVKLDYPGKDILVGLQYESVVEPLLQDLQTSKDGTSLVLCCVFLHTL